ncbi:MAG TPA: PH domain-containing protein [Streptosporangiaceae bacterium]
MSRVASTKNEQAAVDKYLLPREIRVATVRRHPAVLLAPSAQAVGGLLVAAILTATILRHQALIDAIVWAGWGVLMLKLIWDAVNWAVDYFVITSDRILLTSGVFTRSVAMMPLSKVTDMSFHRSFAGRMLGYGEFVVESAGQDQALRKIDHIPYPEQLYLVVCGRIFKDAAAVETEFEDEPDAASSADTASTGTGPMSDADAASPSVVADETYGFDGDSDQYDEDEL